MSFETPYVFDEREVLALVAAGNEYAFSQLFNHYRNGIYSFTFKLTKSSLIAEEIVQDVFLKIWLNRIKLTHIQNFKAYLFVVTRNDVYKVLNRIALNYKTESIKDGDEWLASHDSSDAILEKEYSLLLKKAVDRLPSQQKQVYNLIKNEGLRRNEVAHQLELQPETVKFHLTQAMKNIRAFCLLHIGKYLGLIICLSPLI